MSKQTRTPLCIISDSADTLTGPYSREHDHVVGEPLAEQLDQCLRKYTDRNRHALSERRRQERREWQDRRRAARALSRAVIPPRSYSVGPFVIDPDSREVSMNNRSLFLSTKEFQLFHLLASNVGKVLAADVIILELWPESSRANKSDLYQYIHLLRRKIEEDPQRPRWLVTVKGVGYQLRASATL
ncbi:winged helix-turn-helix domain-containing protein [Kineobactrum salinum]|uniref:Response regulator transcription factor n=1 Tax=Kineobactrum salinum TaxID=2708301 RepID=A0A6C0U0J6_9GAMM|nr:winged helix-turn-helix domain-containing protein [Kineobactrum salinum]QIB65313.1 response regulator transcription factor [Kineobactrum salinum]